MDCYVGLAVICICNWYVVFYVVWFDFGVLISLFEFFYGYLFVLSRLVF